MEPLANHRFGIFPVAGFQNEATHENDLAFHTVGKTDHSVSLFALEPKPGEKFAADRQRIDFRRERRMRDDGGVGSGSRTLRFGSFVCGMPGCIGRQAKREGIPEHFLKLADHLIRDTAEGYESIRDGAANFVKRGDRKGFPEQVKPHRLPDRLALFPVKLLLSALRKLFPFRLQDPEPKKGRGNGFPVDAQGEENVSFLGVGRVRGIRIRIIFQGSPAGRLFVCRTPDGPEGIA